MLWGADGPTICTCDSVQSIDTAIEASDLVIIGQVTEKTVISKAFRNGKGQRSRLHLIRYTIKVDTAYKGINKDRSIDLYTTKSGASCGLALDYDQSYILFGNKGSYLSSDYDDHFNNREKILLLEQ